VSIAVELTVWPEIRWDYKTRSTRWRWSITSVKGVQRGWARTRTQARSDAGKVLKKWVA
jgi:hypothetical protein